VVKRRTGLAARVDPYAARARVVVMTDFANEPDDQMSMVRFLVYANRFDVEGLILCVEDAGSPTLTSYRRIILTIKPAAGRQAPRGARPRPGIPEGDRSRRRARA
jgi:Protein of unknown function (DUF1593)